MEQHKNPVKIREGNKKEGRQRTNTKKSQHLERLESDPIPSF